MRLIENHVELEQVLFACERFRGVPFPVWGWDLHEGKPISFHEAVEFPFIYGDPVLVCCSFRNLHGTRADGVEHENNMLAFVAHEYARWCVGNYVKDLSSNTTLVVEFFTKRWPILYFYAEHTYGSPPLKVA